ncbi:putative nucleolar protein 5-3 isoform X3 [Aegilops tauschii subsp. strangulata]|uniref:putative nucleolar protein 5-3 isoform X3 n=1 Tax=Aegilops tauschii subsp. strangulata TaxID=200361 RepID=UPI001ABCD619
MGMLVLFKRPAGLALFKVLNQGKLDKVEDLWKEFTTRARRESASYKKVKFICKLECTVLCHRPPQHIVVFLFPSNSPPLVGEITTNLELLLSC